MKIVAATQEEKAAMPIENMPESTAEAIKKTTAFSRGYQQGVAEAIRLMRAGRPIDEVETWMRGTLANWRYSGEGGENPPPCK